MQGAAGKEFRRLTEFRTSRTQALDMPFIRHNRTPFGKPDRLRNSVFQLIQSETRAAADSAYAPAVFGRNIFQLFSRRPAIRQITFVYYKNYISAIHAENFLNESLILLRYARRTVKQREQHTFCGSGFVQSASFRFFQPHRRFRECPPYRQCEQANRANRFSLPKHRVLCPQCL